MLTSDDNLLINNDDMHSSKGYIFKKSKKNEKDFNNQYNIQDILL